jgi:hypothetical protein
MDEAKRHLRWALGVVLLPFALVASLALVLVVTAYFYARALLEAILPLVLFPFRPSPSSAEVLPRPHFSHKARLPK